MTAKAILLMVLSSLFFTTMTLCVKVAGRAEDLAAGGRATFGALEAVFVRSAPMAALCCYLVVRDARAGRFRPAELPPRTRRWLLARGIVGATSMACLFYASLHIPLATTSLLSNTSVFFTGVLAHVFLGERLTARRLALVLAGFLCVGLVLYDGVAATFSPQASPAGLAVAVASGFLSSVAYFSVRKLKAVPGNVIILSLAAAGLLLPWVGLLLPGGLVWPRSREGWTFLWLSALPAIAGQLCMTAALRAGPAGVVSSGQYMGPVFATLFGIAFFAEHPSPLKIIGGLGVMCFGVAIPLLRAASWCKGR